jgi:hypothetical protein
MAQVDRKNPDLRVSDAERDAVITDLGQHFQVGRLDRSEFDERVAAALRAKTRSGLDQLLTDLPPLAATDASAPEAADRVGPADRGWHQARLLAVVPLLIAAVLIGGLLHGGWQHGWPFAPFWALWLIIPALVLRARIWGRRRQWR